MDYSTSSKLAPIVLILQLGILCVALDNTIIATAIPRIGDELYALSDTVLICLLLFEVRSLFCALAPNSTALIIGRAIAGIGSAGLFSGALIILAFSTLPEKRPIFTGLIIAVYDIASMVGPLIGGAFTDHLTWHWCFYLPIGGIPSLALIVFLHLPPLTPRAENTTWHEAGENATVPIRLAKQRAMASTSLHNFYRPGIPVDDPETIVSAGATDYFNLIRDMTILREAQIVCNDALTKRFQHSLTMVSLAAIGAAGVEWKRVKAKKSGSARAEQFFV
ncbi:HC-toxin efflux carrier TOXA 18 [Seiridium cupressi]